MKSLLSLALLLLFASTSVLSTTTGDLMPVFVFEGTWFEMGEQYGENCTHLGEIYEFAIGAWEKNGFSMKQLKNDVSLYAGYIEEMDEDISNFMEGIGEGSGDLTGDELFSPYEKVVIINAVFEILWLNDWHGSKKLCTSIGAFGNVTLEGHTIVGLNRDLPAYPFSYQIAYVLKPSSGLKIFGTVTEGQVASNFQVNSEHLCIGAVKVLGDWSPEKGIYECSYGVPSVVLMLKLSMCRSTEEALDILNRIQVTQGMNYIMADTSGILVVEKLPFHYALREPEEEMIVVTNQMSANYSYEGDRITGIPMGERVDSEKNYGAEAVAFCYNSAYWALIKNRGRISPLTWMNVIGVMDYCYDEYGNVVREVDGIPVVDAGLTVEYRYYEDGKLIEGTIASHCCDLNTLEIYWVQGLPSEHNQWQKIDLHMC